MIAGLTLLSNINSNTQVVLKSVLKGECPFEIVLVLKEGDSGGARYAVDFLQVLESTMDNGHNMKQVYRIEGTHHQNCP